MLNNRLFVSFLVIGLSLEARGDEASKHEELVDGRGMIFDQKDVSTSSVWWYVVIFSMIIVFICMIGCANICYTRDFYKRKCQDILGKIEEQHKQHMKQHREPTPFGHRVVPNTDKEVQFEEHRRPAETTNIVWNPITLAQVLHQLDPDQGAVDYAGYFPFKGVLLTSTEQKPNNEQTKHLAGINPNVTINSTGAAAHAASFWPGSGSKA